MRVGAEQGSNPWLPRGASLLWRALSLTSLTLTSWARASQGLFSTGGTCLPSWSHPPLLLGAEDRLRPGNTCPSLGADILPWDCSSPGAFPAPFPRELYTLCPSEAPPAPAAGHTAPGLTLGCSCRHRSQHGVSLPGLWPRGSFCRISPYSSFLL